MVPPAADDRPVFVYGTLRPGRANWAVAEPWSRRHEPATLPGFGLYALAYPVVARVDPTEADTGVVGDLLWLDPPTAAHALARLDEFEGVVPGDRARSYYHRALRPVRTAAGVTHDSWVYLPGDALLAQIRSDRRVPGDDWPDHGERRR